VATSLDNLAEFLSSRCGWEDQRQYAAAEPLYRRSLAIRETTFGPNHPDVAQSLNNLAGLLSSLGQYAAAEPLYRRSLAIRETTFGPNHPDVAQSLNNLAGLLRPLGQYAAAEPLYRRSLAIRETTFGPNHPDVAQSLNNLAGLLGALGQYVAAEPLYRRSLAIREKTFGPNHPDVATSLNSLAEHLRDQRQYGEAESLYRRSLSIRQKTLGLNHARVASSLNNLALLLHGQGQYSSAEPLYRRSLAIFEKALGPDHPDVATSLNNLAGLLSALGQYTAAEPLHRRSLIIREKALGPDHPDVAQSLSNLAELLSNQGKYDAVETLHRQSLAIREKTLGPHHPDVAQSLNNLAELLRYQGKYGAAESFYRRSLAILVKVLRPDHPTVAFSLSNMSLLLGEQGRHGKAIMLLHQSLVIQLNWLIRELPLLPDQVRSTQLNQFGSSWQVPFGWIAAHPPAAQLALETRLNREGLLQEIEQRQSLLLNAPGIDSAKVQQLQALTQQLASLSLPGDRRAAVRQQRDALQAEIYRLQPDLEIQTVTIAEVASALPADGVLVEIQSYQPYDGRKPRKERWGAPQYIALVLMPNGAVSTVPLGAAAAIDATVHAALSASAQDQSDAGALWAQLSELLLKPLLPQLSGSRQWFLSPDSELNRVPFAALPAPQQPNRLLADVVQLRVLTTGRDLVRLQASTPSSRKPLVMANPSFDRDGTSRAQGSTLAGQPMAQRRSADLGSTQWDSLPGTEREGQQVAGLLGASLLSGSAATATALKQQQSPQVLHVATHGFFLADQDSPPTDPLRVVQEQMASLSALRGEAPLLRSGLVLAGANQPAADPNDDGHLTAAEILKINLKGTELVVLSACSTGQGEVRTGEGVYGLQRALTVAGARSTLLSLWKVDDAATAEFMVRFYRRLKAGEGRADALAAVQAEFRSGAVKGPSGDDWSDPYWWAAWQLTGDWGPIPGL
jgi:CHAT domain-containing protein